jgi:hypothetical protein
LASARRAIIHIGMPRTGSTTFQHMLFHARDALRSQGILYPDLTPRSAPAQTYLSHQLFGQALDGRRPRHERDALLRTLSDELARTDCDVVLLSYEDFLHQQPRFRVPHLLKTLFEEHGFSAEALVAVKPQDEHLNSMYTLRTLLMRERLGFAHFARCTAGSRQMSYDRLIEPWIDAFSGRVRAVPVRDRRFPKAPLMHRMLSAVSLYRRVAPAIAQGDTQRVENRSPGPVAVEVSCRLRAMRIHTRLKVPARDMMRVVQRLAWERGYDRRKFNGVGPALRAEMDERYRPGNERFARMVWRKDWNDIVAPEPPRPVNELIPGLIDPKTEADIAEIIDQASLQFAVTACHSAFDKPLNLIGECIEEIERRLALSRWRVV